VARGLDNRKQMFPIELPAEPLPGGLIVNRNGKVIVAILDCGVTCFGAK
jgi:hypothetical protein